MPSTVPQLGAGSQCVGTVEGKWAQDAGAQGPGSAEAYSAACHSASLGCAGAQDQGSAPSSGGGYSAAGNGTSTHSAMEQDRASLADWRVAAQAVTDLEEVVAELKHALLSCGPPPPAWP
uniref:Uncharacterized protein n=1 Tax=Haptolina brevifila TaxID=156173 RepID=A0A7S2DEN5_9EUKA